VAYITSGSVEQQVDSYASYWPNGTLTYPIHTDATVRDDEWLYFATVLILMAFQYFMTMAVHCVELIVNVSRDEAVWHCLSSPHGYRQGQNTVLSAMKSWKAMVLLAFKPFSHWLFGLTLTFYYGWGVFMHPP
jgi:hypothetical protein